MHLAIHNYVWRNAAACVAAATEHCVLTRDRYMSSIGFFYCYITTTENMTGTIGREEMCMFTFLCFFNLLMLHFKCDDVIGKLSSQQCTSRM